MRNRILAILAACALLLGGGVAVFAQTSQAGTGVAILCAHDGDRALAVYDVTCPPGWFKATLPAGSVQQTYAVTAPVAGPQGPVGAVGPQGPKGDPGSSAIVAVHKATHLSNLTPATSTVVLNGLPAYHGGVDLISGNSGADCPAGVNVSVSPNPTAVGSTQRTFTVLVSGFGSTEVCNLDVWQLSLVP